MSYFASRHTPSAIVYNEKSRASTGLKRDPAVQAQSTISHVHFGRSCAISVLYYP